MSTFVLVFSPVFTVLLLAITLAMPAIMPPGLPLGVSVPRAHQDDASIPRAFRRWRVGQVAAAIVAIAAAVVLAFTVPAVGAVAPVLIFVVLSVVVYVLSRRSIVAAKRAGDWYADVPVQVSAEVTPPAHHRPPWIWPALAAIVLGVTAAIGVAVYPGLPDPYPVHRDAAGVVDVTAPKTPLVVFTPLLIGAGVAILMFVLSLIVARVALRAGSGDEPDGSLARAAARRGVLATLLSELSAVVAFGLSLLAVLDWLAPDTALATRIGVIVLIGLIVVVLIATIVRARRIMLSGPRAASAGPQAPDDDRRWRGGFFYVDRDDPALFVPKRFGLGWTVNFGHPAGIAIGVIVIVVLIGVVVVLPIEARASR
jgi:uncharacterized membrane protein